MNGSLYGYIFFVLIAIVGITILLAVKKISVKRTDYFTGQGYSKADPSNFSHLDGIQPFFGEMKLSGDLLKIEKNNSESYMFTLKSDSDESPVIHLVSFTNCPQKIRGSLYMLKNHIWARKYLQKKLTDKTFMAKLGSSSANVSEFGNWIGVGGDESEKVEDILFTGSLDKNPSYVEGIILFNNKIIIWGSQTRYKEFHQWSDTFINSYITHNPVEN